jgi:3-dehydroquinate synthase
MNNTIHKTNISNCQLFVGAYVFEEIKSFVEINHFKGTEFYVLVDENTRKYCLPDLINRINTFDKATIIEINSGEKNKTLETAVFVWKKLLELGADRNAVLINLGGGVICDLGGFIASLYKRGILFINIPTTLMSQVDAGFGGKTGVDLEGIKNQIGLFNNPAAVFIYPGFLETLNKRQKLTGYAEIIKYAIISDTISLDDIINCNLDNETNLTKLICNSINTKCQIVNMDYKEVGLRKILNFGHTIGHAIETFSLLNNKDPLLHGEALAIGIICEIFLSVKKLNFPPEIQLKINSLILNKYGKYAFNKSSHENLLKLMLHDKKNQDNKIFCVLMEALGKPQINQYCHLDEITEALDYYEKLQTL